MAKQRGKPKQAISIAIDSPAGRIGHVVTSDCLCVAEIEAISTSTNWKGIRLLDAIAFMRGCGLLLDDTKAMRRLDDYLSRKPSLAYLRRSPDWESTYKPMLIRWRNAYPRVITPECQPHKHLRQLLTRLTPLLHDTVSNT